MEGKNKQFGQDDPLKNASETTPVPVIVEPDGILSDSVIVDQNENGIQIYATGYKENETGEIAEVRLARYDSNGTLVSIHWTDPENVRCGTVEGQIDTDVQGPGQDPADDKWTKISKYGSKACAYVPQSSKGAGKPDNVQISKDGKVDKEATLRNASDQAPIPVIVEPDGVLSSAVISDQNENGVQIYVTGYKENESGEITEVRLARYDDSGVLVPIHWTDPQNVVCGTVAEGSIDIDTKDFVQDEPEVEPLIINDVVKKELRSFVLFDPFMNGEGDENYEQALKNGLGLQREIAKFLGLFDGNKPNSASKIETLQKKINKHICMVPFNDIPDRFIVKYPELADFQKTGINGQNEDGKDERFRDYWNTNIAVCDVPVLAVNCHANQRIICLFKDVHGFDKKKFVELGFIFPKMDHAVFLGCNCGDVNENNFAKTFANCTVGGIPVELEQPFLDRLFKKERSYKVYPTAVIAADGNVSSNPIEVDDFIVGFETRTSKYAPDDDHKYTKFIKGLGYCVFIKEQGSPMPIPGTCSNKDEAHPEKKWIESTVPVTYLLKNAKRMIQGEQMEEST